MRSVQKANTVVRIEIVVYDNNDDPVTGLVNGNFTKLLSKDGVDSAVAVTVMEVGGGRYVASFTPTSTGVWSVVVRHASYNKRGWAETFDVTETGADLFDSANGIESNFTFKQVMRLIASILLGKASGGPADSRFRDLNNIKDRVIASAEETGDRTSMTYDPS